MKCSIIFSALLPDPEASIPIFIIYSKYLVYARPKAGKAKKTYGMPKVMEKVLPLPQISPEITIFI